MKDSTIIKLLDKQWDNVTIRVQKNDNLKEEDTAASVLQSALRGFMIRRCISGNSSLSEWIEV